jgi:hypothetical protein
MGKSLLEPFVDLSGKILSHSYNYLGKPYWVTHKQFGYMKHACLIFCGFSIVLVPLIVFYWSILLGKMIIDEYSLRLSFTSLLCSYLHHFPVFAFGLTAKLLPKAWEDTCILH